MTDFETLLYDTSEHVVTITMNRPAKKNAMSWTMFKELKEAFERTLETSGLILLVIIGALIFSVLVSVTGLAGAVGSLLRTGGTEDLAPEAFDEEAAFLAAGSDEPTA